MKVLLLFFGLFSISAFGQCGALGKMIINPRTHMSDCTPSVIADTIANVPAACTVGQLYFATDATAGQNIYECAATNAWTQQLNSGSSGASTALSNLASVSINTSLLFQTGVDVGSAAKPARDIYIWGNGTFGSTSIRVTGTPTGARVVTIPDATGTLASSGAAWTAGAFAYDFTASTVSLPAPWVKTTVANTYTAGAKQTLVASATTAGANDAGAADPSSPVGGDRGQTLAGVFWNHDGTIFRRMVSNRDGQDLRALSTGFAKITTTTGAFSTQSTITGSDMTNATVTSTQLATANKTGVKSMWLDTPVTGDTYRLMFEDGKAITLTRVACNVIGGTNAVINLRKTSEATSGSGGTAALTSNLTCTSGALVASTTFTSAGVAARIPVALEIVSLSGTNTDLHVFVEYTVD